MSNIKVLFLAANPLNTVWLKLDQEIRMVTEKLRISDNRDLIEFIPALAVTSDDLFHALNRHKPHIVHFSGHGDPLGQIILLNNDGTPKPIDIDTVSELFKTVKDNIRVVIFNACYTMIQAQTIATVIDCAIGVDDEIEDQAAIIFASMFYSAIGFGRSIQDAFDQAKLALRIEGFSTGMKPRLFVRSGVEPSLLFLTACSECTAKAGIKSIELNIKRNFSEYTLQDQDTLLRAIRELLGVDKDLTIIQVKPGSVKLLIQVPVEYVENLLLLVNSGQLARYDVVSAEIQNVSEISELAAKSALVGKAESPATTLRAAAWEAAWTTWTALEARAAWEALASKDEARAAREVWAVNLAAWKRAKTALKARIEAWEASEEVRAAAREILEILEEIWAADSEASEEVRAAAREILEVLEEVWAADSETWAAKKATWMLVHKGVKTLPTFSDHVAISA